MRHFWSALSLVALAACSQQQALHQSGQTGAPVAGGTIAEAQRQPGSTSSPSTRRTVSEIQAVFGLNRGKVYAPYNRALVRNPKLTGKLTYQLQVAPSGEVTSCSLVSSGLGDVQLEQELLAVLQRFDFGPKGTEPYTITWPVNFLPE